MRVPFLQWKRFNLYALERMRVVAMKPAHIDAAYQNIARSVLPTAEILLTGSGIIPLLQKQSKLTASTSLCG